jgi:hypothetical protein
MPAMGPESSGALAPGPGSFDGAVRSERSSMAPTRPVSSAGIPRAETRSRTSATGNRNGWHSRRRRGRARARPRPETRDGSRWRCRDDRRPAHRSRAHPPDSRARRRSTRAWMSPVRRIERPPVSTRSTQEASLPLNPAVGRVEEPKRHPGPLPALPGPARLDAREIQIAPALRCRSDRSGSVRPNRPDHRRDRGRHG